VYFPAGRWYDIETAECRQGPGQLRVAAPLEKVWLS
jgi:alpha-glucosidase (family GH31 glycosyl hydrolase)